MVDVDDQSEGVRDESLLVAALQGLVLTYGGLLVIMASDHELEAIGEAAIIGAYKSSDRKVVGRIVLSKLASALIPPPRVPPTLNLGEISQ